MGESRIASSTARSGFGHPAAFLQDQAEIVVGGGKARMARDGAAENRLRLILSFKLRQRDAPVAQRLRIVRSDRHRLRICHYSLLEPVEFGERQAAIIVDLREVRPQRKNLLVKRDGLAELSGLVTGKGARAQRRQAAACAAAARVFGFRAGLADGLFATVLSYQARAESGNRDDTPLLSLEGHGE